VPEKKYAFLPAAMDKEGVLLKESSSQLPTGAAREYELTGVRERRSHQRTVRSSEAVMMMLRSGPQTMDLMGPWWTPGPISWLGGGGGVVVEAFWMGEVGEEEALFSPLPLEVERERSKMRSFFSKPPVARIWGRGCEGKAIARTMWECWRV